ncbi:hypothetical protein V866_002051 [Kwoniella sp. B9012]
MVTAQLFITVLSLLSISHAILTPAHGSSQSQSMRRSDSTWGEQNRDILPRSQPQKNRGKALALKRGPSVGVGGVHLDIHERTYTGTKGNQKRAEEINGTEVSLGIAQNTFVVPVSIGSPPSVYPLQLDLASSDLLVASTLCTSTSCPVSLGPNVNAYYDVSKGSSGFEEVDGNRTYWNSSYADGTVASGVVVRETVTMGEVVLQGQVMGFINSTNLTLSQQKISGILGLGFPRLSALSHILLDEEYQDTSSSSNVSSSTSASSSIPSASVSASSSSSATSTSSSSSPTYYPPLLENLVRTPHIPYPVFALALAPPPSSSNSTATSTSTSTSATSTSTARYQSSIGSLTLGGVSSHYISNRTGSGRTITDIEWHEVMPFGKARSFSNDTAEALSRTLTASSSPTSSPSPSGSATSSSDSESTRRRKRSDQSQLNDLPSNLEELGEEEYLFWALELHNLSLNGTDIPLNSSYADIGLPSIALLDVGFNGISGPQQDVVALFSKINDARQVAEGRWVVPCDTRMTIGFSFGGRYIQLQPSDWISTQIDSSSFCLAWPIASPSTGDGMDWQLGTPFLKKVYSIYSYGINGVQAPLVGFLPLEDNPSTSESSSSSSSGSTSTSTIHTSYDPNSPTPTTIEDLHLTTTIKTVLPNNILPDPTYTTPTYVYSASPSLLQAGITQFIGLANSSAYSVEQVPVISLDSAATSRIASMAGGEDGGSAAPASSGAMRVYGIGVGMGMGMVVGMIGVLFHLL